MVDRYSTHLPIARVVCEHYGRVNRIMECGMGIHSTPYLKTMCDRLWSVETESWQWYQRMINECELDNWAPIWDPDDDAEYEWIIDHEVDIVLVDGRASARRRCAEAAQAKAKAVICHDSEVHSNYDGLRILPGRVYVDIRDYQPGTAVITADEELISKLHEKFARVTRRDDGGAHNL